MVRDLEVGWALLSLAQLSKVKTGDEKASLT